MSNKPPAFLLCENPISDQSDRISFILHNRSPKLLAQIHSYVDLTDEEIKHIQAQIEVGGRLDYGNETFFFTPVWLTSEKPDDAQNSAERLAGLFRRMEDWYEAYLIWEDKQNGNN